MSLPSCKYTFLPDLSYIFCFSTYYSHIKHLTIGINKITRLFAATNKSSPENTKKCHPLYSIEIFHQRNYNYIQYFNSCRYSFLHQIMFLIPYVFTFSLGILPKRP